MCPIRRIHAAIYHRLHFLISRKRLRTRILGIGNGITDHGITYVFDGCCEVSNHTGSQFVTRDKSSGAKVADFHNVNNSASRHHLRLCTNLDRTLFNSAEYDNAFILIINRVKDQSLKRRIRIAIRCRDLFYDLL